MDRRHAPALILGLIVGLVLCLALLGRWTRDEQTDAPADRVPTIAQPMPKTPATAENAANAKVASTTASAVAAGKNSSDSGIFRGRMIDAATRQPVREFDLEFHPTRQTRDPSESPVHSFTTKDGRFECRGLRAGIWTIFATARGYQRFELRGVEISSSKTAEEVLIPMRQGYALQGRVFDESSDDGIAGATINFREAHLSRYQGNFRSRPSTLSKQDGGFVLDGLPEGPVTLSVFAQNYAARELEVMIGNKMAPVEIALSAGGAIAGYLAGIDGLTPVAGTVDRKSVV